MAGSGKQVETQATGTSAHKTCAVFVVYIISRRSITTTTTTTTRSALSRQGAYVLLLLHPRRLRRQDSSLDSTHLLALNLPLQHQWRRHVLQKGSISERHAPPSSRRAIPVALSKRTTVKAAQG
jgi:hypothetical protein